MHILGITGSIATGKSAVTQMLSELGALTVSADAIARNLLSPGTASTRAVLADFPACADPAHPDLPTIDRRALGQVIFGDESARFRLEALTHPSIIAALQSQIAVWRKFDFPAIAAAEIPLLFEAHLEAQVDLIVVAACAEEVQIARLRDRLGIGEAEARRQIASQWPLAEKIANADVVITTGGTFEDTKRQVEALWVSLSR